MYSVNDEGMFRKIILYANTIKYLKLQQITGQLCKKFRMKRCFRGDIPPTCIKNAVGHKFHLFIDELDGDSDYLSRFDIEQIMKDRICLLHEQHDLNLSTWEVPAQPLWRFNLYYFEYAVALGMAYRRTKEPKYYAKFRSLVESWIRANPIGKGDAWHPYTISMRIPNWLICFDLFEEAFLADRDFQALAYESIYLQYKTLAMRLETWQLGNHYLENLKTMVLCSLLFRDEAAYSVYIRKFLAEVETELLADGFHFELSPMYHRIILEDLLRVSYALKQVEVVEYEQLQPFVKKMTDAMASLEKGLHRVPLFNDSGEGVAKSKAALMSAAMRICGIQPSETEILRESGYFMLQAGNLVAIVDSGLLGPDYMPGHGHCDCLSFELFYKGNPIFVNAGTYKYQGKERKYFRSTAAHNTVMVNNHEQSELWGEHRAARRVRVELVSAGETVFKGSCENYLGEKHVRKIELEGKSLQVIDCTSGKGKSFLHLAPGLHYRNGRISGADVDISVRLTDVNVELIECKYAESFGKLEDIECLVFSWGNDGKEHGYKLILDEGEKCDG